jgi:lysophospholipase L1-like esterase
MPLRPIDPYSMDEDGRMKIQPNSTLVMIGDSITEWGREQPIRENTFDSLGEGYVYFVDCLIGAAYPELRLHILNMGVGGNTVRDLTARWQRHVLAFRTDWLSIMIGINDVWRRFDPGIPDEQQISLEEFAGTLETLIQTTRPQLKGLVLMTPYYVEPDRNDPMRAMMDRYGEAVRRLGEKYNAEVADTQAAMDRALREYSPAELAGDRVHVNAVGHIILARAFLKAVDYSW